MTTEKTEFWTFTVLDFDEDQSEYEVPVLFWTSKEEAVSAMWKEMEVFEYGLYDNADPAIKWNEDFTRGVLDDDFIRVTIYKMNLAS